MDISRGDVRWDGEYSSSEAIPAYLFDSAYNSE